MKLVLRLAGLFALVSFVMAAGFAGGLLDGYTHREYPLAYLGARGVPGAFWFNVFAFVIPGMLACTVAQALRAALPEDARWSTRIGVQIASLSGLAFAAMGLFPLDADDAAGSANGLHASAWMMWWIAFAAAASLLAYDRPGRGFRIGPVIMAIAGISLSIPIWSGVMAACAPRMAFVCWLGWVVAITRSRA